LLVDVATCKVRKPPSSEKIGKTGKGTATEGIFKEPDTLFCRVPTWTLSTKRTADCDTNDEAILLNIGQAVNRQFKQKISISIQASINTRILDFR
jgi:hypothetical protein